ncbi:MAG: zinc-ribbon domain-containing protein [Pseudomonadota bacterium]
MILTCPACEFSCYLDDSTISPSGQEMTCAACGHNWFHEGEGTDVGEEKLARGAHERYLEAVRLKRKARSRATALGIWATALTLFVGVIVGSVLLRNDIVDRWPASASAFTGLGLEVNRFGVEFENVERLRQLRGTVPVLTITADVRNTTEKPRPAPKVRVGLMDDFGREIAHIYADIEAPIIGAGDSVTFSAVLENPPAESYSLRLRFVDPDEIEGAQRVVSSLTDTA